MTTKLRFRFPFRIQRILWCGGLVAALVVTGQVGRATTIFDNTTSIFNGGVDVSTTRWLAGRFCVGPQPYTFDSAALLLNSGDMNRPRISAVRLQIYSQTNNPKSGG